jgi:hypothetical protein
MWEEDAAWLFEQGMARWKDASRLHDPVGVSPLMTEAYWPLPDVTAGTSLRTPSPAGTSLPSNLGMIHVGQLFSALGWFADISTAADPDRHPLERSVAAASAASTSLGAIAGALKGFAVLGWGGAAATSGFLATAAGFTAMPSMVMSQFVVLGLPYAQAADRAADEGRELGFGLGFSSAMTFPGEGEWGYSTFVGPYLGRPLDLVGFARAEAFQKGFLDGWAQGTALGPEFQHAYYSCILDRAVAEEVRHWSIRPEFDAEGLVIALASVSWLARAFCEGQASAEIEEIREVLAEADARVQAVDSDGDGVADMTTAVPDDGAAGSAVPEGTREVDSDGDGAADMTTAVPDDGAAGSAVPEGTREVDSDGDGAADMTTTVPEDAADDRAATPGATDAGVPEPAAPGEETPVVDPGRDDGSPAADPVDSDDGSTTSELADGDGASTSERGDSGDERATSELGDAGDEAALSELGDADDEAAISELGDSGEERGGAESAEPQQTHQQEATPDAARRQTREQQTRDLQRAQIQQVQQARQAASRPMR